MNDRTIAGKCLRQNTHSYFWLYRIITFNLKLTSARKKFYSIVIENYILSFSMNSGYRGLFLAYTDRDILKNFHTYLCCQSCLKPLFSLVLLTNCNLFHSNFPFHLRSQCRSQTTRSIGEFIDATNDLTHKCNIYFLDDGFSHRMCRTRAIAHTDACQISHLRCQLRIRYRNRFVNCFSYYFLLVFTRFYFTEEIHCSLEIWNRFDRFVIFIRKIK